MRRTFLSAWLVVAVLMGFVALWLSACVQRTPICLACGPSAQPLRLPVSGMGDLRSLDPADAADLNAAQFAGMVFPGLVVLDRRLTPVPWAAQSLPAVSADGLTWTFTLRPGLKWSDGAPITAQTYAYSMDRAEDPCNAFGAAYYLYAIKDAVAFNSETCDASKNTARGPIQTLIGDSINAPDPLTLRIQLAQPATAFLSAMTYPTSYAVPQQLIQRYGAMWTDHLADGAGFGGDLFKVTKWDHAGHLILRRNDNFWGQKPALREVDVTFYRDAALAYSDYLAGKEDVGSAPVEEVAQARRHMTFHQIAVQQIDYYAMNWRMAPFDDIRMRQAFAIAIDKQTLASDIFHGAVLPTNHIVPEGAPGYNPNLLGPDGGRTLFGNVALANQLATQYATQTKCGTATDFSHCPPVSLALYASGGSAQTEAEAVTQMWLKAMPHYPITSYQCCGGLFTTTSAHNLQFWSLSWIEDYPDPQDWLSTNLLCASAYNNGNACDQQADALLKAADANPDQTSRLQQYQQAEQLLVTDVAWIPLDQRTVWWETSPKLQGFTIAATGLIPRESWQTMYLVR
ncbi:MAG TPA: peptide ABC transporter substrate-binding protein [Ktedonobacterales bacterium]